MKLTTAQRGYGARWQKARAQYLKAHPYCAQCARYNRRIPAYAVDHVVPHKGNDRLFWDQSNWQGLCRTCHSIKTVVHDGGLNSGATTHPDWLPTPACPVILVTGPAGAGKTSYCRSHATSSDIIIDLDECIRAVSGTHGHHATHEHLVAGLRLRNKLLAGLAAKRKGKAFVIVSAPTKKETEWWIAKLKAHHVLLDPGLAACIERLEYPRQQFARKWYAKRATNIWSPPQPKRTIGLDGWPIQAAS